MKATILLATMATRAAADRSRSYAVLSSTRNDAADVTWLRNPKTATTAFVYGVMPLKPCGDRLRVSEKHEVGCARQACGDGERTRSGIAADQRGGARRGAYWYNPLLGPRNGSAVVVCYDGAAFLPGQKKGDSTSLQRDGAESRAGGGLRRDARGGAATDALRRFYADDARAWDAYCKLP
ncbi:hypothetical protein JL720_3290 [Aureococcus anophagefferens]|nr:hypothetical protein JL720_3290 [Aureococcus anophagefferens]